jgi:hypothetical protein
MNIGFFCLGDKYLGMAKQMMESARAVMPHAKIHHLTDDKSPTIEGVDSTRVFYGDMPMAVRRMMHHSACQGEWLFVDADVIFQRDVSEVFDSEFDIALTDREGCITNEAQFARSMPYNIGVVFSRSPAFWGTVVNYLQSLPLQQQEWMGDQLVVNALVREGIHQFNIKTIPGAKYNYPPKSKDDGADASILHYKGNRKAYMAAA